MNLFEPIAGGIGMARAERLAAAFKVLSEPHRLRILSLLAQQEWTAQHELLDHIPLTQASVSHHLVWLERAGMAGRKKSGVFMLHRLRPQAFDELSELLKPWTGDL